MVVCQARDDIYGSINCFFNSYQTHFIHVHIAIKTLHPLSIVIYQLTNPIFPVHMHHQKQQFRLPQAFNQTKAL